MAYNQPGYSGAYGQQSNVQSHSTLQHPQNNSRQYPQSNPPQNYQNSTYQQGTMYHPQSNTQAYPQPGYLPQQSPPNPNGQFPPSQQQIAQQPPTQQAEQVVLSPEEEHQLQILRKYAHVVRLPMFGLYDPADAEGLRKNEEARQEALNAISPTPQLSMSEKIFLKGLGTATGTEFFNMDKTVNGVLKFSAAVLTLGTSVNMMSILSRWASPPDARYPLVVVDVLQSCRLSKGPDSGGTVYFKTNRDGKLLINGTNDKKCKKDKSWMTGLKAGLISVAFVDDAKVQHPLERVICLSRPISMIEEGSQHQRFKKQWNVPG